MNWEDIFYYDETSPTCLKWKHTRYNYKFGNVIVYKDTDAGCLRFYKNGLPRNSAISVNSKSYYSHRIIYEMLNNTNIPQGYMVDHIDGNPHNNNISNLKIVLALDNSHNIKKMSHNTSGITGVTYSKVANNWRAVWHNGEGVQQSKSFSISKYGEDLAKQLAIEARKLAIDSLKNIGYLYTERHGQ
jgi:hypothetical protein